MNKKSLVTSADKADSSLYLTHPLCLSSSSFLISGDGVVYEGRGWGVVGAHAKEHNFNSVGIAFMGNFNGENVTTSIITFNFMF